jgi:L-lactate dehydrogenase complex protein LldF
MEAVELVEQFKTEAANAGALVYEAKDAADANDYVLKLARERGVKFIVKSKSMLAEEIGLKAHLENGGIEVKETGIGEWLVQLAGERQEHMGGSASYETIEQVAELISERTDEQPEPDPRAVLSAVRWVLRKYYLSADMGISEASIAIAETGTLIIMGSEGNERLVAVLPRIHVTIVGCEELVSTMEEATVRLKLLSKTMMDRKMPSYVTYLTGRNTTADIPKALMARAQGPDEEHIVLVSKAASKERAHKAQKGL